MRVLVFFPAYTEPANLQALAVAGHEVHVVTTTPSSAPHWVDDASVTAHCRVIAS